MTSWFPGSPESDDKPDELDGLEVLELELELDELDEPLPVSTPSVVSDVVTPPVDPPVVEALLGPPPVPVGPLVGPVVALGVVVPVADVDSTSNDGLGLAQPVNMTTVRSEIRIADLPHVSGQKSRLTCG